MKKQIFYHDIDLAKNKLLNARINPMTTLERLAYGSTLTVDDSGIFVYDSDIIESFIWNGSSWKSFGYNLPIASDTVLGGVKIGTGISIDGNGVISVNPYTVPSLQDVTEVGNTSDTYINVNGVLSSFYSLHDTTNNKYLDLYANSTSSGNITFPEPKNIGGGDYASTVAYQDWVTDQIASSTPTLQAVTEVGSSTDQPVNIEYLIGNFDNSSWEIDNFGQGTFTTIKFKPNSSILYTDAYDNVFLGSQTFPTGSVNLKSSIFIGYQAGSSATNSQYSNFLGYQAGYQATSAISSNFLGYQTGYQSTSGRDSNFFGNQAGYQATYASSSNFFGYNAGYKASSGNDSNFFGYLAGAISSGSTSNYGSNFFGLRAGERANNANQSNFFGYFAGRLATNASNSNFLGYYAGNGSANASYSTFLGYQTGMNFTGNALGSNNIIIGTNISLPNATANSLNIGGVIFAKNLYSTTSGNPSTSFNSTGQVGIGTFSPATAAILDVSSTTKGFMMPRVTTTQRDAISSPAQGLLIYNTTTDTIDRYNGSVWASTTGTGTVTGTGTAGQVTYWDGTSSITGSNNFFWDNTNKALGIGTNTPLSTEGNIIHIYNNVNDSTPNSNAALVVESVYRNTHIITRRDVNSSSAFIARSNDDLTTYGQFNIIGVGGSQNANIVLDGVTRFNLGYSGSNTFITDNSAEIQLRTANFNRLRINQAGNIALNGSPTTGYGLLNSFALTGATSVFGYSFNGVVQNDITSAYIYNSSVSLASGATVSNFYHYRAQQSVFSSTPTTQAGFAAESSLLGATNNYGFYGNIPVGTGRYNLYMAGSADNFLKGNLAIGTTGTALLHVGNARSVANWGTAAGINLNVAGNTVTDNTSSGSVAGITHMNFIATSNIAASNSTTYTSLSTFSVGGSPIAGTNVVISNPLAFTVNGGNSLFRGNVYIGNSTSPNATLSKFTLANGFTTTSALGTTGAIFSSQGANITDGIGSGTVTIAALHSIAQPTLIGTNTVTYTNAANLYIQGAPIASTNVTITNPYSLYVAGGNSYFGGNISVNSTSNTGKLDIYNTALTTTTAAANGVNLINSTVSTTGIRLQYSPPLVFTAHAWNAITLADITSQVYLYNKPLSVNGGNSGQLTIGETSSGGNPNDIAVFGNNGSTISSALSVNNSFSVGGVTTLTTGAVNGALFVYASGTNATQHDGIVLANSSSLAATSGIPVVYSPSIRQTGAAWTGAASQLADFRQEVRPVSGSNPITAAWYLSSQINGGGYTDRLAVGSNGAVTIGTVGLSLNGNGNIDYTGFPTSATRIAGGNTTYLFVHKDAAGVTIASTSTYTQVASSMFTVESTTKGALFPRMTTSQKNSISSPAEGLIVYDLTLHKLCVYTGSSWEIITSL